MKLSDNHLSVIYRFTDKYRIDQEKLISYLEKHKTIKNDVFGYCSKVSKKAILGRGFSMFLDNEPMFTPIDREIFIRRIPFYFYQIPMGNEDRSALSIIIPIAHEHAPNMFDYEEFYKDLEWMYYELNIPLNDIFTYVRGQLSYVKNESKSSSHSGMFPSDLFFNNDKLTGRELFQQWRHYLHLCIKLGISNYTPVRFITAYNTILEKSGLEPIIYYPIKRYGYCYVTGRHYIECEGHFPCDENGNPIFKWMSIRIKNVKSVNYSTDCSELGKLRIELGPKTVVYVLDKPEDHPEESSENIWYQLYAGPLTMEFDNDALREFRKDRKMTQNEVATAIGTSVRTYQKWESGETTPDGHYLLRLLNWLDIDSVQDIIKYIDLPEDN